MRPAGAQESGSDAERGAQRDETERKKQKKGHSSVAAAAAAEVCIYVLHWEGIKRGGDGRGGKSGMCLLDWTIPGGGVVC